MDAQRRSLDEHSGSRREMPEAWTDFRRRHLGLPQPEQVALMEMIAWTLVHLRLRRKR